MIKKITLVCLFIVCRIGLAQSYEIYNNDTINFIDAGGKKQGYWIYFGKMKRLPGYAEDQKVEEGKFTNDLRTGKWISYHPNQNKKSEIEYKNNRPDGYAVMYHENGNKAEEGLWKGNRWVGDYKLYHKNGKVQQEFRFNPMGKRDGVQKYFDEDGNIQIEAVVKEGKEEKVVEYYPTGEVKSEKSFNNGVLDVASVKTYEPKKPQPKATVEKIEDAPKGADKATTKETVDPNKKAPVDKITGNNIILYRSDRQISKSGDFLNGKLISGKSYIYDDNGILRRVARYENGRYIGDAPLEDEKKK